MQRKWENNGLAEVFNIGNKLSEKELRSILILFDLWDKETKENGV